MPELSVIETIDPMVSIIVVANGRHEDLARTLRSVAGQTFQSTETMVRCAFEDIGRSREAATAAFGGMPGSVFLSISHAGSKGWQVISDAMDGTSAPLLAVLLAGDVWHEEFLAQAVQQFRTIGRHGLSVVVGCESRDCGLLDMGVGLLPTGELPTPAMVRAGNFPLRSAVYRREAIERVGSCDPGLCLDNLRELNLRLLAEWDVAMVSQDANLIRGESHQEIALPQSRPRLAEGYSPGPYLFTRYSSDLRREPGSGL
jgi:cellulose synthase/poly-beta-1,6-N-acetylglucosamine synthase-like glycosyltransferase